MHMKIRKLLKYLPIAFITACIALTTTPFSLLALNTTEYPSNQLNISERTPNADDNDQLEYIRNDVAKQTGVTNSIASIKLVDSSSLSYSSAALVTKTDSSTLLYM